MHSRNLSGETSHRKIFSGAIMVSVVAWSKLLAETVSSRDQSIAAPFSGLVDIESWQKDDQ